ncbi:alpha/beta hydrolase [Paenibacillus flagellatus]|uniref:Enterochelin esterase n=1 Tax=Paenibacillus flagellatus TaxID=2211139 RepID=A0A2V5L0U1_9BACL|nr:alpha/beta hydrolase-fold protein [Paenibacillus flagellatus]PYI56236.1 enterochelin esterase [Paenibacillus flagellatus]
MTDSRYTKRTIIKEEVASSELSETRTVKIYLPPGYNELLTYPVLYTQDGEDFFNFGRVATHANRLILDEGMEPVLIVGVDVDKTRRNDEYAPEGSRFAAYCRFFADELVPFVESRYPARRDRAERVIAGDSLGGTVSLHIALDYPDAFNRVLALSGAFFSGTRERIAAESELTWLELYMLVGLQETSVETSRGTFDFVTENRLTRDLLNSKGAELVYEEKDGKHVWGFWQNELPGVMMRFFG